MPSSAWFAFRQMVTQLKKDFPKNFVEGPYPELTDKAVITWDKEGYFRILFPCDGTDCLPQLFYKEGKIHKHASDNLWYIVTPSQNGVQSEVASQT